VNARWLAACLLSLGASRAMAGIGEVRLVPVTAQSTTFGSAAAPGAPQSIDLAARGYVEAEYFVTGTASVYARDGADQRVVARASVPYTTRIIVRRPATPARFSGSVIFEPMHPQQGSTLGWSAMADYIIRSGHVYVAAGLGDDPPSRAGARNGAPLAADLVAKWFDPQRYRDLNWPEEDGIRWDVMSDLLRLLKSGEAQNPLHGYAAARIYATGWSFTGSLLRTYINEGFHEAARAGDGGPLVDGYLVGISSRWNGGGYLPLNSSSTALPIEHPRRQLRVIDVPVIEFMTANEVAAGNGPQLPDSDAPAGGHRLYQLGASNHSDSFDAQSGGRLNRPQFAQLRSKGYPFDEAAGRGCSLATSDVPIAELSRAAMDNLIRWSRGGEAPPRAAPLQLAGPAVFAHDVHGNPLGGIRIAEFDVPRARYDTVPPTDRADCNAAASRTPFYRFDFSAAQLQALYGSRAKYLAAYQRHADELVKQHWLLASDGKALVAKATVAAAALPTGARATPAASASFGHYQPPKQYTTRVSHSFYLPMRDGTRIAMRVTQPAVEGKPAPGRFPVIWHGNLLITEWSTPPGSPRANGYGSMSQLTDGGYVIVQVARRGNGQSFGARRGYHERNEAFDAYEITEWLAAQPWSNGRIGVYGCSNTGDAAMHTITVQPPHLKAVWAGCFSWSKYDAMRRGGVFAQWGTGPQRTLAEDMAIEPVDGDADKTLLRQAATEHQLSTVLFDLWKGLPYRDSLSPLVTSRFWPESSISSYMDQLRRSGVALYIQGAWHDELRDQGIVTFLNYPGARVLIGPWRHCENPGFALIEEMHRFFDQQLKDIDTGLDREPAIHYYTVNAEPGHEWRTSTGWPVAGMRAQRLYLGGSQRLQPEAPAVAAPQGFAVNTQLSCPEAGEGALVQPCHLAGEGISFTGDALRADTEVTGDPIVELRLTVDRTDADVFAYLEDVDAGGKVSVVTEGRLRSSLRRLNEAPYRLPGIPWHRSYAEDAAPLTPGENVTLRFAMLPASYVFKAGHRLQITVTGADHRQRDRDPAAPGARVTLNADMAAGSFVDLPLVAREG
jgi:uncharacterized protein